MIGINHQENYEAFLHNQAKIGRYDNFIDKNPYATFTDFEEYDALQKYYANMPDGDNSDIPIFAAKVGDYSEKLINDPHARSQFINEYLRPALETGAMMAGGLSSGFAAKNPYLALLGGAGGYVVGKNTADNLDYYFGLGEGKPQGLMQSIAKTFDDYYDGLKQEALGAILPFGVVPVVANSLKKSKIVQGAGEKASELLKRTPFAPQIEKIISETHMLLSRNTAKKYGWRQPEELAAFVEETLKQPYSKGNVAFVGNFPLKVLDFIGKNGIELETPMLALTDRRLFHAKRDLKENLGKTATKYEIATFANRITKPETRWFYDKEMQNVLFAFVRQGNIYIKVPIHINRIIKGKNANEIATAGTTKHYNLEKQSNLIEIK